MSMDPRTGRAVRDVPGPIDHEIWVIWRFCSIGVGGCTLVFGTLGMLAGHLEPLLGCVAFEVIASVGCAMLWALSHHWAEVDK